MELQEAIKMRKLEDVHLKAYLEILFTASFLNNQHSKLLIPYNISPQQYTILRILRDVYPQFLHIQSIRSRMLMQAPNTTRLIDKLISNGYVVRERRSDDRRKVYVRITDAGIRIMHEIDAIQPDFLQFMHGLSDEDARQLSCYLKRIRS